MALTRMIFAVHMTDTQPTRLRVTGDVGTPAPVITSLRRGGCERSSIGCVDGAWTMDLDAGDYVIEMQVEHWIAGRLDIVTELAPGQSPPTFVYYGPLSPGPSPVGLDAWSATALYIDPPESSFASDPKDPSPPPRRPSLILPTVTLTQTSSEWFTAELAAARTRIASQLVGKSPPMSVLDALVSGL